MAGSCNGTQTAVSVFCGSVELWILLAVVSTMLVLSLCWNILCCVAKLCSEKWKIFQPRFRRSFSLKLREMEDNPIYGNINYTQTRVDLPLSSSSMRDHQRVKCDPASQSKGQDCYANLSLKPPKPQSVRSSPKIQYSEVVTLPGPQESEETFGNVDTVSLISDLYASVQTERTKALDAAGSGDGYANHI